MSRLDVGGYGGFGSARLGMGMGMSMGMGSPTYGMYGSQDAVGAPGGDAEDPDDGMGEYADGAAAEGDGDGDGGRMGVMV